jgi:hypothetical protein
MLAVRWLRRGRLAPGPAPLSVPAAAPKANLAPQVPPVWGWWEPVPANEGWDPVPEERGWNPAEEGRPRKRRLPEVSDPALLWKEMCHATVMPAGWTFPQVYAVSFGLFLLFEVLLLGMIVSDWYIGLSSWSLPVEIKQVFAPLDPVLRFLAAALAGAWCLALALRSAACMTREREQDTLVALLTLPIDRGELLQAKWLGTLLRYRQLGALLLAVWTAGLVMGALHPLMFMLLALACIVHGLFLTSLGLWLSVLCRKTLWAYIGMMLVLLLLHLGWLPYRLLLGMRSGGPSGPAQLIEWGLNPAQTWWYFACSREQFRAEILENGSVFADRIDATLLGLLLFFVLAWLLWLAANARFAREQIGAAR